MLPRFAFRRFTFPVLVTPDSKLYQVAPVFLPEFVERRRRLGDALRELRLRVCDRFRRPTLSLIGPDSAALWLSLNPPLIPKWLEVDFKLGYRLVKGQVLYLRMAHRGLDYVLLPGLRNDLFIADRADNSHYLREEIQQRVLDLLRRWRREEEDFDPRAVLSQGNELVTKLSVEIAFQEASSDAIFSPTLDLEDLLSMGRTAVFDGAAEIQRVGDLIGRDLDEGEPQAEQREALAERLRQLLFATPAPAVVLMGAQGVGKIAVVREAVRLYQRALDENARRYARQLWRLDPARIIAGMSQVGQWEQRFAAIMAHVRKREGLLYFDNPVGLLRYGRSAGSTLTLADMLQDAVQRRTIGVLLEATPAAWQRVQEFNRDFADLFQVIAVDEPEPVATQRVLIAQRRRLERLHGCRIEPAALRALFKIHGQHFRQRAQPGRLVAPLQRLATRHRDAKVGAAEVREDFRAISGIGHALLDPSRPMGLERLRAALAERLIGQPQALRVIEEPIVLLKAGLNDPQRPVSTLLFVGPTGVGKTQAAKALAQALFGDDKGLVRFDMSEFIDAGAALRLIGGLDSGEGQLTTAVRRQPFCVLLLDEIEKAHPDVHDLLLQVLGEGRLTDALGQTTDFSNCIILMTSNLGAREAASTVGFVTSERDRALSYRKAISAFFRPELINRIDRIVDFAPLELEHVLAIARLLIRELMQREGFVRRNTLISVSDAVLRQLVEQSYDRAQGGRALKRGIEQRLVRVAAAALAGTVGQEMVLMELLASPAGVVPRITPFRLATQETVRLPAAPAEAAVGTALARLLAQAEPLRDALEAAPEAPTWDLARLTASAEEGPAGSALLARLHARESLIDLIDALREALDGEDLTGLQIPSTAFRMRRVTTGKLADVNDLLAQRDIRDFLNDLYQRADSSTNEQQRQYLLFWVALTRARLACAEPWQRLVLHYQVLADVPARPLLDWLLECHGQMLPQVCRRLVHEQRDNASAVVLEGPSLWELFAHEQGVHLLMDKEDARVPITLTLELLAPDADPSARARACLQAPTQALAEFARGDCDLAALPAVETEILRVYVLPREDRQADTVTDLRTGLSQRLRQMTPDDWCLLFYAALPASEALLDG